MFEDHRRGPFWRRDEIRGPEFQRDRNLLFRSSAGFKIELLRVDVEHTAIFQRPSLALRGHQVPAMDAENVQAARDRDMRQRTRQRRIRGDLAMDAEVARAEKANQFRKGASIELDRKSTRLNSSHI